MENCGVENWLRSNNSGGHYWSFFWGGGHERSELQCQRLQCMFKVLKLF